LKKLREGQYELPGIEKLKAVLTKMMKKGCMLMIPAYGAEGRIVSIGFRPYWTNPGDSKIEKLEINFVDNRGRVVPLCIYSIIGYEIVSFEGRSLEDAKNISLDIHSYANVKGRKAEKYDTLHLEIGEISDE